MSQCTNCDSRFFKTLETRMLVESFTGTGYGLLLLKKRCKRCKYKLFFSKEYPSGRTQIIPYSLWLEGVRISNLTRKISNRFQIFAGEFSKKVRRSAEKTLTYLNQLEKPAEISEASFTPRHSRHG